MREDGDLFLGGEHDVDRFPSYHFEQLVEPDEGLPPELGDRQECTNVTSGAGEAHRVRCRDCDVVSHAVQPGRHLPGGQAGPFREKDAHPFSIYHTHMLDTNRFHIHLAGCCVHPGSNYVI